MKAKIESRTYYGNGKHDELVDAVHDHYKQLFYDLLVRTVEDSGERLDNFGDKAAWRSQEFLDLIEDLNRIRFFDRVQAAVYGAERYEIGEKRWLQFVMTMKAFCKKPGPATSLLRDCINDKREAEQPKPNVEEVENGPEVSKPRRAISVEDDDGLGL